jgi:hypothetical protein
MHLQLKRRREEENVQNEIIKHQKCLRAENSVSKSDILFVASKSLIIRTVGDTQNNLADKYFTNDSV